MSDPISLGHGKCIRTTENVSLDEYGEKWIPKSVIHDNSEVYTDDHEGETIVNDGWWTEQEKIT